MGTMLNRAALLAILLVGCSSTVMTPEPAPEPAPVPQPYLFAGTYGCVLTFEDLLNGSQEDLFLSCPASLQVQEITGPDTLTATASVTSCSLLYPTGHNYGGLLPGCTMSMTVADNLATIQTVTSCSIPTAHKKAKRTAHKRARARSKANDDAET